MNNIFYVIQSFDVTTKKFGISKIEMTNIPNQPNVLETYEVFSLEEITDLPNTTKQELQIQIDSMLQNNVSVLDDIISQMELTDNN